MDWDDIRIFSVIVECGSFGKAAERLGITQPTISRRVDQLEGKLGYKVFNRTATGATLTEAGKNLAAVADKMTANASEITKMSEAMQASGRIKVKLPDILSTAVLLPQLDTLLDHHPQLQLVFESGQVPMEGKWPTLTLHFDEPTDLSLTRVPLGHVHYSAFGTEKYFQKFGEPESLIDCAGHRLIHAAAFYVHQDTWDEKAEALTKLILDDITLVTDSGSNMIEMIRNGTALGAMPTICADIYPEVIPMNLGRFGGGPLNLYYSQDVEDVHAVSVITEWLKDLFSSKNVKWFDKEFLDPYSMRRT